MKTDLSVKVAEIIKPSDDNITRLAKMAANICEFANNNPFHVDLEDCNFTGPFGYGPFGFNQNIEKWLEKSKETNCQCLVDYMYELYHGVLKLTKEQREQFWSKFNSIWDEMINRRYLYMDSRNDCGCSIRHKKDGIYWKTNRGEEKVWPIEYISPEEYQKKVWQIVNHKSMLPETKLKKLEELTANYGF